MPKTVKASKKSIQKEKTETFVFRPYELTIVVSPLVKSEKRAAAVASVTAVIEELKGKVEKTDEWGLRDLAYPIKHQRSGWYVLLTVQLPTSIVSRVDQAVLRDKNVLRHLIVSL